MLFCVKTNIKESWNFEQTHLKKNKKTTTFWASGNFWFNTFAMFLHATRSFVDDETLKGE